MTSDPYRTCEPERRPSHVEAARCSRCARLRECISPISAEVMATDNPDGRCARYTPSMTTRFLRVLGLDHPTLIEAEP